MPENDPAATDAEARLRETEELLPPYTPPGAVAPIPYDEVLSWIPFLQDELRQVNLGHTDLAPNAAPPPYPNLGGRPRQYSRDHLLAEYDRVRKLLGRDPSWSDLNRHARVSRATLQFRIGNMPALREAHREWAAAQPPDSRPAPSSPSPTTPPQTAVHPVSSIPNPKSAIRNPLPPDARFHALLALRRRRAQARLASHPDSPAPATNPPATNPILPPPTPATNPCY